MRKPFILRLQFVLCVQQYKYEYDPLVCRGAMRGSVEDRRSPAAHGGGMRGGIGGVDAAGSGPGGGGKRGDACLAEIQRLEKNRANRRNRMEKARCMKQHTRYSGETSSL